MRAGVALLPVVLTIVLVGCGGSPAPTNTAGGDTPETSAPVSQSCPDDLAERYARAGFVAALADNSTFVLPNGLALAEAPNCVVDTAGQRSAYFVGAGADLVAELGTVLTETGYVASASNSPTFSVWESAEGERVTASAFSNALAEGEISALLAPLVVVAIG